VQTVRQTAADGRELDFWQRAADLRGRTCDALWGEPPADDDDASVIAHDEHVKAELAPRYWRFPPLD
jgi:hypothetical protein